MEETGPFPNLSIEVLNGALTARLEPSNQDKPLDPNQLKKMLVARQMADIELDTNAVDELLDAAQHNDAFTIELNEKKKDEVEVSISEDKLSVHAEIKSGFNSLPLTAADLKTRLDELKVDSSLVMEGAIRSLLETKEPTVIAQGRAVVNGTDTQFEPCFFIDDDTSPLIDEHDTTLYFETKQYVTVEVGDPLMRRVSPVEPIDGINVFGKVTKAKKGKQLKFKKCPGAEVSVEDENLLVATVKGHPVEQNQGTRVDETLVLRKADLESGNIHFDGSVMIQGDVLPQVRIIAIGDIFVKGTVENADLIAGNNIVIGGGVISETSPDIHRPPKITTRLSANNELHARFLNLAKVYAGSSLVVQSYVLHSDITAGNNIMIGDKGGKGALIGGKTYAGHSITANILGSSAYIATEIACGGLQDLKRSIASLTAKMDKRSNEAQQLNAILTKIKDDPASKIGELTINRRTRITNTVHAIEAVILELGNQLAQEQAVLAEAEKSFIQASKAVFPKVAIKLHGSLHKEQIERGKSKFVFKDGEIQIQ
ncbi:MAG: hypothetical protein ACI82A_001956 [Candidatus Azotimanducaceae bacterium]|jgi:uncharacterized protein (DUF342 family)